MDSIQAVKITSAAIAVLSYFAASYKAGCLIFYSEKWWGKNSPKFKVISSKIPHFIASIALTFVFMLILHMSFGIKIGPSAGFAVIDTLLASWALTYWILLEKIKSKKVIKKKVTNNDWVVPK